MRRRRRPPTARGGHGASIADVFRLAKAMPSSTDQPGLLLELDRLARASGITLGSITPQDQIVGASGATLIPIEVIVGGSYRQITRFLASARQLVTVRRGRLSATGRLFTVQGVELSESSTRGFPLLDGTIKLNAYVYDGPIAPPSAPDTRRGRSRPPVPPPKERLPDDDSRTRRSRAKAEDLRSRRRDPPSRPSRIPAAATARRVCDSSRSPCRGDELRKQSDEQRPNPREPMSP